MVATQAIKHVATHRNTMAKRLRQTMFLYITIENNSWLGKGRLYTSSCPSLPPGKKISRKSELSEDPFASVTIPETMDTVEIVMTPDHCEK